MTTIQTEPNQCNRCYNAGRAEGLTDHLDGYTADRPTLIAADGPEDEWWRGYEQGQAEAAGDGQAVAQ